MLFVCCLSCEIPAVPLDARVLLSTKNGCLQKLVKHQAYTADQPLSNTNYTFRLQCIISGWSLLWLFIELFNHSEVLCLPALCWTKPSPLWAQHGSPVWCRTGKAASLLESSSKFPTKSFIQIYELIKIGEIWHKTLFWKLPFAKDTWCQTSTASLHITGRFQLSCLILTFLKIFGGEYLNELSFTEVCSWEFTENCADFNTIGK